MSLAKISVLAVTAIANHVAFTPPTPPPSKEEIMREVPAGERFLTSMVRQFARMNKYAGWIAALCEIALIIAVKCPSSELSKLAEHILILSPQHTTGAPHISISSTFLVGCGLTTLGGFIRWLCYRTLGRNFTFELAVVKDHRLRTDGLYSVVRHPSYTGLLLDFVGPALWIGSHGSWLRESGLLFYPAVQVVVGLFLAEKLFSGVSLFVRTATEDRVLRKEFGKQWEDWAERVRYRLVPGLY
ncbi:hypothetical protein DAEQUDRAFT_696075 [Daedalea quercina L-15889]|uniref:Protein-S-isoprenylcysteine O-methyltransferase n=1 Tax=Daedalea quercina L-15889 TaxID=1314783 RepID=A0A165MU06_9APHY|nr:hypothetical protein DAEQUDRAFT_696075 [Daedalea quercina L-15889]